MLTTENDAKKGVQMINLVGWGLGILFIFSGIVDMFANFLEGLLFTLIGLVILPKFWRYIEKRTKIKNGWIFRIIILLVLIVLFGSVAGK